MSSGRPSKLDAKVKKLILDAILGIQDGQNPRVLDGMLKNYLAEKKGQIKTTEE